MNRILSLFMLTALLVLAGGCNRTDPNAPVTVGVIGDQDRILTSATAQGLVRHDGAGQIEPGLSIRWAISEDGLFYTFRLADMPGLEAKAVARKLRAAIAHPRADRLRPLLGAIREIVAVTPAVVEIRLDAPRPNLLDLLAQPELALNSPQGGTGPFLATDMGTQGLRLVPVSTDETPDAAPPAERDQLIVHDERASVAILAFLDRKRDLVLGGRFTDFPLTSVAGVRKRDLRLDPVNGLFGLMIDTNKGFLAQADNRRALSMAIDRASLLTAFGAPGWPESSALLPPTTLELAMPAAPDWADLTIEARLQQAKATVAQWHRANRVANRATDTTLRIALPKGPGATLLFIRLRETWRPLGVRLDRVGPRARAELRLVDEVAPSQSASWYLRHYECGRSPLCSRDMDDLLAKARTARDPDDRSTLLAEAEARLIELTPFIPLAQPLRWSLVTPRMNGFQTNSRGVHPLNHLLQGPT